MLSRFIHFIYTKRLNPYYLACLFLTSLSVYFLDQSISFPRGLEGKYYATLDWQGDPQFVTLDPEISTALLRSHQEDLSGNRFSAEWKGFLRIKKSGRYTFATTSDDGSDLYVNHQRVVDNGGIHGSKEAQGQIDLEPGVYPIRIRYFQAGGSYQLEVLWTSENQPLENLPSSVLSPYPIENWDYKLRYGLDYLALLLKIFWLGILGYFLFVWVFSEDQHDEQRDVLFSQRRIWSDTLTHSIKFYLSRSTSACKSFFSAYGLSLLLVFFTVFIVHFSSPNRTSFDSRWSIHTAMSILKEGDTDLDEYKDLIDTINVYYGIEIIHGHLYNLYPVGVSLLAVPFVYVIEKIAARTLSFNLDQYVHRTIPEGIELFIASFIVALTAVTLYLLFRLFLDNAYALLLVFIFAFCTSSWSTASRALWQHGPSMWMLAMTLYLILLAKDRPWLIQFASIPLALSYIVRPTNSVSIVFLTLFVFLRYRPYFLRYLFWAVMIAIPFLSFNVSVYHTLLPYYYVRPIKLGSNPDFLEALTGNLISPSRGLFIFSPILLFSFYGVMLKVKKKQSSLLDYLLLGIFFLHWIAISSFNLLGWGAGTSFGPRLFCDMIPYFMYFLIPAVEEIFQSKNPRRKVLIAIFFCFVALSFFVHYRGATHWDTYLWNITPIDIGLKPERLWDWRDIQFLRGLGN
jgi:hypothetical protein